MLLDYFDERNRVVVSHRLTWVERKTIYGEWSWIQQSATAEFTTTYKEANRFTRHCVGTYQYVGMDYTTACSCRDEMIQYYTRTVEYTQWNKNTGLFEQYQGGIMCMANVSLFSQNGGMWGVKVDISEHESLDGLKIRNNSPSFDLAAQRSYEI